MFYELFEKRKQIRWYDQTKTPDKALIEKCLEDTHYLVASKQNLMPYKVWVFGPFNEELNKGLYDISSLPPSKTKSNHNLENAPYQFIYTVRLAKGNSKVIGDLESGHNQPAMDFKQYKRKYALTKTNIEIGMHATVLSSLLIEHGLDVSYTLCFQDWLQRRELWQEKGFDIIDDEVQFIMSAGYADIEKYQESPEEKPNFTEVVQWI